jgi:hypothetical protein
VWLFLAGAYTIVFGDNMNDRIKELFEQAGTDVSGKWMSIDNAEKFAESVIRECVHLVDTLNEAYEAPSTAGKFIKEHFGVE